MLEDITLDTNVLMHADDPRQSRRPASQALLRNVLDSTCLLCLDEGFDLSPSRNRSLIAAEYLQNLRVGGLGYALVATLAASNRVRELPRSVPGGSGNIIRRLIIDRTDRKFLAVAYGSDSRTMYSHDFTHFPKRVRVSAAKELGVTIMAADD
jgi:hypothetical protein